MEYKDALKYYRQALERLSEIELKGKSMPYTSSNTHMFSQLSKDGILGIRLSKNDQESFDQEFGSKPFTSYGAVMRDYVSIPEDLLVDADSLSQWLQKSLQHVKSLPAK